MSVDHRRTTDLLRQALTTGDGETVAVEQLLAALQARAFGVLLLVLAMPNFIPVPIGIGGVMGVLTILLGLQMLAGLEQPWMPLALRRRPLRRQSLERFLDRSAPLMRRLERACRPRLRALTGRPGSLVSGLMLVLLGVLLALPIPFTNYLFGALLLAYAVALIEGDGVLLLLLWLGSLALIAASATLSHALLGALGGG